MRKILYLLLAVSVFFCTLSGASTRVEAAGWPSYAQNVSLDKTYTEMGYQTDPYLSIDASYVDIFRFSVPASGKITLHITSKTDSVPSFRMYRTNNTEDSIWFGYEGNRSSYDYDYNYDGFYSNWSIDLASGSYYLMILYGSDSMNVNFNYTLKYKPTFSNSKIKGITGKKKAVKLTWKKADGATGYKIQYSTSSSMSKAKTVTIKSASKTSKTFTGLKSRKKYYFRIKAYKKVNVSGKTKTYSKKWSAKKSVKTK